jgi:hypothetical protein
MEWLDYLQWPAMAVTVAATYLLGSQRPGWREAGFVLFLSSNALWVAWGWHAAAWALVILQFFLAVMNVRGVRKSDDARR